MANGQLEKVLTLKARERIIMRDLARPPGPYPLKLRAAIRQAAELAAVAAEARRRYLCGLENGDQCYRMQLAAAKAAAEVRTLSIGKEPQVEAAPALEELPGSKAEFERWRGGQNLMASASVPEILTAVVAERGGSGAFSAAQFAVAEKLARLLADASSDPKLCIDLERLLPPLPGAGAKVERVYMTGDGTELRPAVARLFEAFSAYMPVDAGWRDEEFEALRKSWAEFKRTYGSNRHGRLEHGLFHDCECMKCADLSTAVLQHAVEILGHEVEMMERRAASEAAVRHAIGHWSPGRRGALRQLAPYLFDGSISGGIKAP